MVVERDGERGRVAGEGGGREGVPDSSSSGSSVGRRLLIEQVGPNISLTMVQPVILLQGN